MTDARRSCLNALLTIILYYVFFIELTSGKMELLLHYRWEQPKDDGLHAIRAHGRQLLAELRQLMPICMKAELE